MCCRCCSPVLLCAGGLEVLEGAGKISHKKAMEKAEGEYRKYQVKTLSSVEKAYIETLKELKRIEVKKKSLK